MSEEIKTNVEDVSTQPEATTETVEVSDTSSDDVLSKAIATAEELAKALEEKDAELLKAKSDSENYKKMGLKYKEIAKAEGLDVEEQEKADISTLIAEGIAKALGSQKAAEETAIQKANRTIDELKRAVASRSTINNLSTTASNKDEVKIEKSNVSAQELADIKKLFPHWTDTQLKKYSDEKKQKGI